MKLCNFLPHDPGYKGKGLAAGSKLDKVVWDEFDGKRDYLKLVANRIREIVNDATFQEEITTGPIDEGEFEAHEGRVLYRKHRYRVRIPVQPDHRFRCKLTTCSIPN